MPTDEAKLIVKFEAENKKLHQQLDRTTKRLDRFEKGAKKNVSGVSNAFKGLVSGVALAAFTRKIVNATKIQEAAVKQLEQGLASTGNVVGKSLDELTKKASELQAASTFGDEEIIRAMSQLVTFTGITGDQFDRTTQAVLDLSTRMDQDLRSSVVQLGKALNDPVSNLGALGRAGIQFSDSQKETIKGLAETNRLAEAQNIILEELERQFGGSAAAARDTLGGALDSLSNAFGDLFEQKDGASELTGELNQLTSLLQDPATVQAVQTLTGAIVSSFAAATKAITGTVNVVKFLAEEFAAFVHGPALGDLPRLNDQLEELIEKREKLSSASGRNARNNGDRLAALNAEIEKTREMIRLSQEMSAPAPAATPAASTSGSTPSAPTVSVNTGKTVDPYADSLKKVKGVLESVRAPQQVFADNVRIIDSLLEAGKITQGEYNLAHAEYKRVLNESTGANAQWVEDVASAERHAELAKTEIQKLEEQLKELYALAEREPNLISAETVQARAGQIKEQIKSLKDAANETGDELSVFADEASRNIQDALGDTLTQTLKGDFDNIGQLWGDMLTRMAAEAAAQHLADYFNFDELFSSGASGGKSSGGDSGGGFLSSVAGFFGGFFADGGYPDPNKISVVGEAGPEVFVPNGVRGEIVPNHKLGGSNVSVGQMVFPGVRTEKEAKMAAGAAGRELAKTVAGAGRYR